MPDPIAYFITWTTYGTWLSGDERGWVEHEKGIQPPNPERKAAAQALMTEEACTLDAEQRRLVEETIARHCQIRGWTLHAVNCRTNHVHVVVSANRDPDDVREQFKAWCMRKLKELERTRLGPNKPIRENWWTERGSCRSINDDEGLEAVIRYVLDGQ
jgi:REP element-mobilizing transposase RayT